MVRSLLHNHSPRGRGQRPDVGVKKLVLPRDVGRQDRHQRHERGDSVVREKSGKKDGRVKLVNSRIVSARLGETQNAR